MNRGHTKKDDKDRSKSLHNLIKSALGDDFASRSKAIRRNGWRDWRKESGQGDASLRRYLAKKMK